MRFQYKKWHAYTEEETQAHVAGQNARREGRDFQAEFDKVPGHLKGVWYWGWRRVGRGMHRAKMRDRDFNKRNFSQSAHMVRTEVETLEEACELIYRQRVNANQAASRFAKHVREPLSIEDQFRLLKARQAGPLFRKPITLPQVSILKNPKLVPEPTDPAMVVKGRLQEGIDSVNTGVKQARQRLARLTRDSERFQAKMDATIAEVDETINARLRQAVASLTFGIEDLLNSPNWDATGVKIKPLVKLVSRLAASVNLPPPQFTVAHKKPVGKKRHCENCGDEFVGVTARCPNCLEGTKAHQDTRKRRENEQRIAEMEEEAERLSSLIREVEEVL